MSNRRTAYGPRPSRAGQSRARADAATARLLPANAGFASAAPTPDERPCPACGCPVVRGWTRCRFCGEGVGT